MNALKLSFILFSIFIQNMLNAQCSLPSSNYCDSAKVFCSLEELNGFMCTNQNFVNQSYNCSLCQFGGYLKNPNWWAFTSQGGNFCITLNTLNCSNWGDGLKMGIWEDCDCTLSLGCNTSCNGLGVYNLCGKFEPCKVYYFYIDGCFEDICDFQITTMGGGANQLIPLGNINNDSDQIIEFCVSEFSRKFSVNAQKADCQANYFWNLDGITFQSLNEIELRFEKEGEFQLCVSAIIGNPKSGSICDQQGPICATVKVIRHPDRYGAKRILCYENTPYKWHDILIDSSGVYRSQMWDSQACIFDSVVAFEILPSFIPKHIYYLSCAGESYYDSLTKNRYSSKLKEYKINLQEYSQSGCDSFYYLSTSFPKITYQWNLECNNGEIIYNPNVQVVNSFLASYNEKFSWYKQNDLLKTVIDTSRIFKPKMAEIYCLKYQADFQLDTIYKSCSFEICHPSDYLSSIVDKRINGPLWVNKGNLSNYFVAPFKGSNQYGWSVQNGTILTISYNNSRSVAIKWDENALFGKVCFAYLNACDTSQFCIDVKINVPTKTNDYASDLIRFFPNPNNGKFEIIGLMPNVIYKYDVYSLSGLKLVSNSLMTSEKTIELDLNNSSLTPGVYYLRINNENFNIVKKILIEK